MPKYADRLPFTPLGDFVATKQMKVNGKLYKVGDEFPVKKMALSRRKIRTLYDGKFITMKGDVQSDEPEADTEEEPIIAGEGEFIFDPEVHELEYEDNEYWVVEDGNDLLRVYAPMGKKLDTATDKTLITVDDIVTWAEEE